MTPAEKKAYVRALTPITSRVRTTATAIKLADGSSRWTDDHLTVARLEQHVNGGPARGVCPIKEGESVTMLAVLDMDSHKGQTPWPEMLAAARNIRDALTLWGMAPVAFRSSGGKGLHLIMLWDTPQDAYSVREAIFACLDMAGFKSGAKGIANGQVEVFPKQDEVNIGEYGNQVILPLAGASEPVDIDTDQLLGKTAVLTLQWPMSVDVAELTRPQRTTLADTEGTESLAKVRSALMSITNDGGPNSPDYEEWHKLCCAVHEATGGSEEGKELFAEWSAQNAIFDEQFFEDRVWEYLKDAGKRSNAITRATLYKTAKDKAGWGVSGPPSAEGFDEVIGATSTLPMSVAQDAVAPWDDVSIATLLGLPVDEVSLVSGATRSTMSKETMADALGDEVGFADVDDAERPVYERDGKTNQILPIIGNLLKACRDPNECRWQIAHDKFRDEIMVARKNSQQWRPFGDADYTRLAEYLEREFQPIGKERLRDAVYLVAHENQFDSAILWIDSLPGSSAKRIDTFMTQYMGVPDSPYARAVSRYMWTALAGRVLDPGCQADMAPVFIGDQGSGKTSAVKAISPAMDFYVEVGFHEKEDDLARKMRGRLVGEVAELTGMRKKEVEALKAFMTRTHENWVPKFKEFGATFPRRLLFIGTTNEERFLVDSTGNRRWLPIRVGKTDITALRRDVLELWAEARDLYRAEGIQWAEAERLAREIHKDHEVEDPWEERVTDWLDSEEQDVDGTKTPVKTRTYLTTGMVLVEALRIEPGRASRADEMRVGALLRKLGWGKDQLRIEGRMKRVFVPTLYLPENSEVGTDVPF